MGRVLGEVGNRAIGDISQKLGLKDGSPEKMALHAMLAALQAKASGGNPMASAAATAGAEWVGTVVQDYLGQNTDLSESQRKSIQQWTALMTGAAIGGVVGGNGNAALAGGAAALDAERFNRQLHESEKQLAKKLAAQSRGKYTQSQIEEQMRGMTATIDGKVEQGGSATAIGVKLEDDGGTWLPAGRTVDGKPIRTQELADPDAGLRAFIVQNTTGSEIPSLITYAGSYSVPVTPKYSYVGTPAPTAKCANTAADCAAGFEPPLTSSERAARNLALANYFSETGTNYSRVAAIATTAGQPQIAASFEAAAGVAALLEQIVRPSLGQVVVDSIVIDQVVKQVSERLKIPVPVVLEATEKYIKPQMQSIRDKIDGKGK